MSVAVALVGVLIALYVADWATSFPESVAAVSAPASVGGSQLTLETVGTVGAKESPAHPTWVSYLVKSDGKWVRSTDFTVPANSVVHVTLYEFDSADRAAQPVPVAGAGHDRRDDDRQRQDGQLDQPRRSGAHVRGAGTRRVRAAAGRPRRSRRTCAKKLRANRRRATTTRSRSASERARRGATAGSASCPAAPATSTATAGRCRRSATWTASSMWSSATMSEPNHARRFAAIWLVSTVIAMPLVIILLGPLLAPTGSDQSSAQRVDMTVLAAIATPVVLLVVLYLLYSVIYFRQPHGADARRPGGARRRARPDDVDRRHLRARARARRVRHGAAGGRLRRGRRQRAEPADRAQRTEAAGAGDRAAVDVHLPLSRPTAASRPPTSCCR